MKRLLVYFFYDADGVVDDYNIYLLSKFQLFCTELLVVVNGYLNEEGLKKFEGLTKGILIRDNTGLDAYAYKEALEFYGYNHLEKFDEVILTNFTSYGPIYPLQEMFDEMGKRNCDFWGVSQHTIENKQTGDLSYHVQSYFVVYRRNLFLTKHFKAYWDGMPFISSYADSVEKHEQRQTPYFSALGFRFDSYIDIKKYIDCSGGISVIVSAEQQLVEDRSPLLKRRVFHIEQRRLAVPQVSSIIKYIRKYTNYNTNLIYNNIVRTQNVASLPNKKLKDRYYYKFLIFSIIKFWQRRKYLRRLERLNARNVTYSEWYNLFNN